MRACAGCRRRKIKCDSATTNQWPCGACQRLKLNCDPPTLNYDRAHGGSGHISGLERVLDFDNSDGSGDDEYFNQGGSQLFELQNTSGHMHASQGPYSAAIGSFNTPPYSNESFSQHEYGYDDVPTMALHVPSPSYRDQNLYNPPHSAPLQPSNNKNWGCDTELSIVMGELKIDASGIGTFIPRCSNST